MSQLLQSVTKNFWAQVQAKSRKDFNKQAEEVNKINRLLQLELYIAIVLKTYEFADDVQMKSGISHFRFVILFDARSTLNRFALVNQAAHTILIPENMAAAFAEIRAWLEGLYKHSTDQIPAFLKKPDGTLTEAGFSYITDDENRKLFKYLPPLTKMRLAYNHRLHFLAFPSSPREAVQTVEEEKKQLEQTYDANHVFLAQAAQSEFKSDLTISGFSFICAGKTATATTPVIEAEQQTPAQQPRP
jgi:hypothetical protein